MCEQHAREKKRAREREGGRMKIRKKECKKVREKETD